MNIALIGYGKMGKAIESVSIRRGHHIVLKIDLDNLQDLTIKNLKTADVAIEFTGPETAIHNLQVCLDAGVAVVSGSTGWLANFDSVRKAFVEKKGTLLYSSNFSIGVNIFFEINKKLASLMARHPGYNVDIEEIHHTQKKDAPSGTAITLAEQVLKEIPGKRQWVNEASTNENDLVIMSKRIDPAPGTHTVTYFSGVDDLQIIHTAHNREGFALGAVLAAEFIAGKTGIFEMKEVLGIS